MRILIIKLGSIGDIVHALPVLAVLRRTRPEAEISWVVEQRSAEILRGSALIDNLIEVDTHSIRRRLSRRALMDIGRQIKGLRQNRYDVSIDLQGLMKSATIGKIAGARHRWGFSGDALREPTSRLLLTDAVETPPGIHVIRKNLILAGGALGLDFAGEELEFPIATTDEHIPEARSIAEEAGTDFALLNPAGGWVTKLWPAENFGVLADRLWEEKGLVSVVATGPNETELAENVAVASRSGRTIFAQPSLKGFYELAKLARVYVGGDTGPTHLAVAAKAPVVGLFGPTEWWRNGSPNPDDICVERLGLPCRIDCHRRTCSKWICMDSTVESVFDAVTARLKK